MPLISEITNEQTIRLGVTGPDGANTLYVINAVAHVESPIIQPSMPFSRVQLQETYSAPLGPSFASGEERFVRGIATAGISATSTDGDYDLLKWSLSDVDADFDDDAGRVQLTFHLDVFAGPRMNGSGDPVRFRMAFPFQVMILAAARSA